MNYSHRFWLYAPLGVFLILAAAAGLRWWMAADALERKLDALNGHQAIPGVTLSYGNRTVSGFPFNLDVVFTGFKLAGQGAHGPFAWECERFALHALTYGRPQQIYEAAGQQSLKWTDGFGKAHQIRFLPGSLRASAISDAAGLARFDLDLVAAGGTDGSENFTLAHGQFHLRRTPGSLDTMISAEDAKEGTSRIASLSDYASFTHAEAFGPLLAGGASWPDAIKTWRMAGGTKRALRREAKPPAEATALASAVLTALY